MNIEIHRQAPFQTPILSFRDAPPEKGVVYTDDVCGDDNLE